MRPRIGAALTEAREIIKEVPSSASTTESSSVEEVLNKKRSTLEDEDDDEPSTKKKTTSYSSPKAISEAAKNALESCQESQCETTN